MGEGSEIPGVCYCNLGENVMITVTARNQELKDMGGKNIK